MTLSLQFFRFLFGITMKILVYQCLLVLSILICQVSSEQGKDISTHSCKWGKCQVYLIKMYTYWSILLYFLPYTFKVL